ncbi:MAG: hypothetical protein HY231_05790 [Acidobacteria bacterium]|nr:hypothetical protein [Acidobacteriota bacterium]
MSQTANPEARHRLSNLLVALLAILFVTALLIVCNGGIRVGFSNHTGLLPVVRRLLDANYLPDNFSITLRLYHHRSFVYMVAALAKFFGEDNALILLSVLGYLFLSAAMYALCRSMKLPTLAYLAFAFLVAMSIAWTGFGLEANTFLGNRETQPPIFAHAALLLSLASYLRQRFRCAALFAGLVLLFHLQIGFAFALILLPFFVLHVKQFGVKEAFVVMALYLLPAVVALFDVPLMLERGLVKQPFTLTDINFRQPWHFELKAPQAVFWFVAHLLILAAVYWWLRRHKKAESQAVGVVLWVSLAITALSLLHLTDYYVVKIGSLVKFQFLRMSVLVTVFGALSLVVLVNAVVKEKAKSATLIANLSLMLLATVLYAIPATRQGMTYKFAIEKYAEQNSNWVNACLWIRQNTPPNAVFLSPPGTDGFIYLASRSNVVEFKINPDGAQYLQEWYGRLRDLAGGTLPDRQGFANAPLLNKAYAALSDEQLLALAQRYQASYALLPKSSTTNLEVVYENAAYKLVILARHR